MTAQAIEAVNIWLTASENKDAEWLFGNILRERMKQADYLDNAVIQVIAQGKGKPLASVVREVRAHTLNPDLLLGKAVQELKPESREFDSRIEDFLAEMVSVIYLSKCGFKKFEFLQTDGNKSPDLRAADKEELPYFVEVKNLREPNSPTVVAFTRWHRKQIEEPDRFRFTASIDFGSQMEPDLNGDQVRALKELVDSLAEKPRPHESLAKLPDGMEIGITARDGEPTMLSYGTGGQLDCVRRARAKMLLPKVLEKTSSGLRQLYAPHLSPDARRLLVLRWRVPDDTWLVAEEMRNAVRNSLVTFLEPYFPSLEIHILTNIDNLEG